MSATRTEPEGSFGRVGIRDKCKVGPNPPRPPGADLCFWGSCLEPSAEPAGTRPANAPARSDRYEPSHDLLAQVSVLIRRWMEGRGFSPAVENGLNFGALAPEAALLQGLKARSTVLPAAARLKPRPSRHLAI
jgi:hypothetical protein